MKRRSNARGSCAASLAIALLYCGHTAAAEDKDSSLVRPAVPAGEFRTRADHAKVIAAWLQRVVGEPFEARAKGQPWEEEGKAFVHDAFLRWQRRSAYENDGELATRGRHLRGASKCNDPLVRCLVARLNGRASDDAFWHWLGMSDQMDLHSTNVGQSAGEMNAALEELEKLKTPRGFLSAVMMETAWSMNQVNQPDRANELRDRAVAWLAQALADGSYQAPGPEEEVLMTNALGEPAWRATPQWTPALRTAVNAAPLSEWAHIALEGAWRYGAAIRASHNGQDGDRKQLATESSDRLAKAWKLHPFSPEPVTLGYHIASNEEVARNGSAAEWFARALAADFDGPAVYLETATWLRPDWFGSVDELSAFGRACVATRRFDTSTPLFYLDALKVWANNTDWRPLLRSKENGDALLELARGMIDEPTRKEERARWESLGAVWAWLGGKDREAAAMLAKVKNGLRPIAIQELTAFGATSAEMQGELAIRLSPARADFLRAEDLYDHGSYAEAVAAYDAAAQKGPDSDPGKAWLQIRRAVARFEDEYNKDGWVLVPLDVNAWEIFGGKWSNDGDGVLQLEASGRTEHARFRGALGLRYELRGDYRFSAANGAISHGELGVDFRCVGDGFFLTCLSWQTSPTDLMVGFREGVWGARTSKAMPVIPPDVAAPVGETNHFYLATDAGGMSFSLNKKRIWKRVATRLLEDGEPVEKFGFSAHDLGAGNVVKITGLQIRRLPEGKELPMGEEGENAKTGEKNAN